MAKYHIEYRALPDQLPPYVWVGQLSIGTYVCQVRVSDIALVLLERPLLVNNQPVPAHALAAERYPLRAEFIVRAGISAKDFILVTV
jgi:hypothetical protein